MPQPSAQRRIRGRNTGSDPSARLPGVPRATMNELEELAATLLDETPSLITGEIPAQFDGVHEVSMRKVLKVPDASSEPVTYEQRALVAQALRHVPLAAAIIARALPGYSTLRQEINPRTPPTPDNPGNPYGDPRNADLHASLVNGVVRMADARTALVTVQQKLTEGATSAEDLKEINKLVSDSRKPIVDLLRHIPAYAELIYRTAAESNAEQLLRGGPLREVFGELGGFAVGDHFDPTLSSEPPVRARAVETVALSDGMGFV